LPGLDRTAAAARSGAGGERGAYLHIGPPKTGTTYLQSILWSNQKALRQHGVLLPGKVKGEHFRAAKDIRLNDRDPEKRGDDAGMWRRLSADVRAWKGRSVLSSEWMAGIGPAGVRAVVETLGDLPVHVVITVRDLGRLVPAVWQERIKNGGTRTLPEFLAELSRRPKEQSKFGRTFWQVHDTRLLVRRWLEHVPPERVHLVVVPPPGMPHDELWTRFAGLFVDDPAAFDTSAVTANPSLGAADAEFLRQVNVELDGRIPKLLHSALVKKLLANSTLAGRTEAGGRITLDADTRAWLAKRADKVIDELVSLGCDVVGDLDELRVAAGGPPAVPAPEDADASALARAGVVAATKLLLVMQDAGITPDHDALVAGR
jgi:hypothetical protein